LDLQQFEDKHVSKNGREMNQDGMVLCPIKRFNPGAFYKPGPGFPAPYAVVGFFCVQWFEVKVDCSMELLTVTV
jgi:hypothetical protein